MNGYSKQIIEICEVLVSALREIFSYLGRFDAVMYDSIIFMIVSELKFSPCLKLHISLIIDIVSMVIHPYSAAKR